MQKHVATIATHKRPQTSLIVKEVKSVLARIKPDAGEVAEQRPATYQGQQKAAVMVLIVENKVRT